jgi:hypothetical protein
METHFSARIFPPKPLEGEGIVTSRTLSAKTPYATGGSHSTDDALPSDLDHCPIQHTNTAFFLILFCSLLSAALVLLAGF